MTPGSLFAGSCTHATMKRESRTTCQRLLASLLVACCLGWAPSWALAAVAHVQSLKGIVTARAVDGTTRTLTQNAELFKGDEIATEDHAAVTLLFTDGTRVTLAKRTRFAIDAYSFRDTAETEPRDAPEEETFSGRVCGGIARFATGLLGKRRPAGFKVNTAVATIGIRGTFFVCEVQGESATVVLLEPEVAGAANEIEVSNSYGSVSISQAGYGTEIPDAHSPPSPPRPMRIETMTRMLRSVQTIQRVRIPRAPRR